MSKKLNLGCGEFPLEGYTNVDLRPPADVIGDFTTDFDFKDVDEVIMSHVLEHLPWGTTNNVLALVRSWMNSGGKIIIEVPDMAAAFNRGVFDEWAKIVTYGIQDGEGEYHKAGFTLEKLAKNVMECGFELEQGRTFLSEHRMRRGMPCIEVIGIAL